MLLHLRPVRGTFYLHCSDHQRPATCRYVHRILHTWGLRFRSAMLRLYITDREDREHLLQGEDSLYQILGANHPLWFRGNLPRGIERPRVSPFCPYVLRLTSLYAKWFAASEFQF